MIGRFENEMGANPLSESKETLDLLTRRTEPR